MSGADLLAPPLAAFGGAEPPAPDWFRAAIADAPERLTVTVQGAPIEVLAWGRRGDPGLLLLHGNGAHADWYSFIAPLLARGRRVVAPSYSGMGGSGWRLHYGCALWADEAMAVAEATGLFEAAMPPTVVAHSFGGFVLSTLAARHGERLARAVIIDAPLRVPAPGEHHPHQRFAQATRSHRVYASLTEALVRFRLLPAQGCANPFLVDWISRRGLKQVVGPDGRPGWTWRFDPFLFRHFEFGHPLRDLGRPQCPLVLVRGGRSRLITRALFEQQAARAPAGTALCEVPDADHHVMLDQPLALVDLLAELAPAA